MPKTNYSFDSNHKYSALDVVLVKTPGLCPFLKRFFLAADFDDAWICLDWNDELHLCKVIQGRLMYGPTINSWKGHISAHRLSCTIINFKTVIGTEAKARRYIGQRFRSTANCIAHIFGLLDAHNATVNSLYNERTILA